MSGRSVRILSAVLFCSVLAACGGGGGGGNGGGGNTSSAASSVTPAPVDTDGDGHPDNQDAFPNDPKEWKDSDKDGVGDNSDVFPNDPTETQDSDKDGVGDNKDAFPNDPTEWIDTDKDGVGDNSDPSPMGDPIPAWSTYQGNAKHTGLVDVTLSTDNFKQRWSKSIDLATSKQGAAGDGYIFFNSGGVLVAADARNGATLWSKSIIGSNQSFYAFNPPAYADGIVYVQTGGHSDAFLWAFNAVDGELVFQTPLADQWSNFYAPTIVDGTVYIAGGYFGGMYAIDAKTGAQKWWQTLNQYDQFTPAISGDYAIAYTGSYSPKLTVANRHTGNVDFEITDPGFDWSGWSMNLAPVVAGEYVLANYNGRLVAFNLTSRLLVWELKPGFKGQPVVKGDHFYIIRNGSLEVREVATGNLVSSISGSSGFTGDPLVTNNLLFVRDEQNTYAYQLDTSALVWTLVGKSGAFSLAEGALLIFTPQGVVAIDVEGDIDADGLPDWWEKRYKKNIDPASDVDGDGLTALQEFNQFTNPLVADTDGDGLLDGEEVNGGKSSPLKADTDGDGLNDYQELKTYLTDATKVDTDGDTLTDAEEVAAGLNPLDANDALADADGDGFSNLHELRANTGINDANSRPQMNDWSMQDGNSQRNNYIPVMLNDSRFSERWSKYRNDVNFNSPVTVGDKLILRRNSDQLVGWDFGTGAQAWQLAAGIAYRGASTAPGKLIYFSGSNQNNYAFNVVDAATGSTLITGLIGTYHYDAQPLVDTDTIYVPGNNSTFKAYSLTTGNLRWTSATGTTNYYGGGSHLLGNNQLIAVGSNSLTIYSTANGTLVKTINVSGSSINKTMLGSKGNVIVQTNDGKLRSINIADGTQKWVNQECNSERWAVGNGQVYLLGNSKLCVIDEQTGLSRWNLVLPYNWGSSNIVPTASHLFYSDGNATYGINLALKAVTWTIAKSASQLLMGADGTLYLQNSSITTAIDTEGDTDADGMLQWWERRYGGDLVAEADIDNDGLTNVQEFTLKTNPLVADTDSDDLSDGYEVNTSNTNPLLADSDKDGLSDGAEINTHHTNPLLTDSDGDNIDDAREIALGLDPLDEDDASADNDNDGYSNRDEAYSDTDINDANSKPVVADWAMTQGNARHDGFQPYRLDEDDFGVRWIKTFSTSIKPIATGGNHVFVNQGYSYSANTLLSLNAVDGKQQWKHEVTQSGYASTPVFSAGQVVQLQQSSGLNTINRYDADLGTAAASINISSQFDANRAPNVLNNIIYTQANSSSITATRLDTGASLWTSTTSHNGADMAVNDQYLFYSYDSQINALNRATGIQAFSINAQTSASSALTLGSRNNILAYHNGLVSYDLATRKVNWQLQPDYSGNFQLAVGNGQIYQLVNGELVSRDEVDGKQRWVWRPDNRYLSSNIVVTLSHIFVAGPDKTYALSVETGILVWSYNAGGSLALGADGALYIQSSQQLVAITLEGDSDGDGMPDWWERHYGLDASDSSDASLDLDSDGLTNLEEFTHGTYANRVDSDGDSLNDADEVNTHHTNPTSTDSDGDGMRDDWEITNNLDPLDAADRDDDADGDTIPNYFEFLVGTDPNNILSAPPMFSAGTYSFEDGNLPSGWILSDDTTDVSISLNNASHGTKSLLARGKADISFVGFFTASDLSLDVKSSCNYYNGVEIYIDDQLIASGASTLQWSTLKTVIPLGLHTVSIRTSGYGCNLYLDNVVIAPAKTNTQLGLQFVALYNDQLQFVAASKDVVRNIRVKSPASNLSTQAIATLGNEKIVVAFTGSETRLGVLDLLTFNWRYFEGLDQLTSYYYSGYNSVVARGNFAYVATRNAVTGAGSISRVNLSSGAITRFGSHLYNSLTLDSSGFIYAYSDGVVYKYDAGTLALVSQMNSVNAQQILMDTNNRLIVTAYNEIVRYNAQRLIEARLPLTNYSARAVAVNGRSELLVATQNNQIVWYSADWQRSQTLNIPAVHLGSFPQIDTDEDGLPDWWELANGMDLANAADASTDVDNDGLTALEEFAADTNPLLDDTDGDLVNDGDEVKEFKTNPHSVDTDGDGLTDAEEILQYLTNPLLVDSDADSISDFLEVTHFLTDPNDPASKPAPLVNFTESFENTVTGWITPSNDANAGWTIVNDLASNGSKSLRSSAIDHNQKAVVEWAAVFNQSSLIFDARVSAESCCDRLYVYVDGELKLDVRSTEQWQTQSLPMTAGYHTIRFVYGKDGSAVSGSDAAWIDNIRVQ